MSPEALPGDPTRGDADRRICHMEKNDTDSIFPEVSKTRAEQKKEKLIFNARVSDSDRIFRPSAVRS